MNIFKTLPTIKFIALFGALFPIMSFAQLSAETSNDFSEPENKTVEPSETSTEEVDAKVLEVKKISRYAIGFVVDVPSISDVLTYMKQNLGVDIEDAEQLQQAGINTNALTTRNFEVVQNENGAFEVNVRFYPPANPMDAEVIGIQKKSREQCADAMEQLKADAVN